MNNALAIIWDVSPEIFRLGSFSIRWYGFLFALGFIVGQRIMVWIFKKEGKNPADVELLTFYMVGATIIGARLGHCLFYQPDIYLSDPIKILKIWEGGLASHGAAFGILFGLWLYAKKRPDQSYSWILDRIVITVALAGCFIRLGNLMNSEIIGKPASHPFAFQFVRPALEKLEKLKSINKTTLENTNQTKQFDNITCQESRLTVHFTYAQKEPRAAEQIVQTQIIPILAETPYESVKAHIKIFDETPPVTLVRRSGKITAATFLIHTIPRHPAQLYEALSSLLLCLILCLIYKIHRSKPPSWQIFSIFLIWIFGLRFLYEFLKENQVSFEDNLTLNMGQNLSIPLVLLGLWLLLRSFRKKPAA